MRSPLLRVENLRTWFDSDRGPIRAVDGVDFELESGRTLGLVGESGSGKSVTALSVMRLVDETGHIADSSRVVFDGRDLTKLGEREMESIRGNELSMIFQEPMTSLNPVFTVSEQIAETVRVHQRATARGIARSRCSTWWAFPSRRGGRRTTRTRCRAGCGSAS